jgi:recombination protein RecA
MDDGRSGLVADSKERQKALAAALAQIEKQFGKGSIMRLADGEVAEDIDVVSTGSLGLDVALGIGGLPRGRVVEVYGPESSGKTTLTLQVIAEMQKIGGTCAFIDAEHALDVQYASKLGVNLHDLLISQPDTGEQALEIADALVRSGSVDLIVIDSVAALTPNPETTTGGNALKFYASVRLDIRRIGSIKKGEEVVGSETKVKVVKNKVAPPFKQATFDILYGEGISREGEILDLGAEHNIVDKSGAWYSYGGERIGQGKDNAREFLREHREMALEIENRIREKLGVGARVAPAAAAAG